MIEFIKETHQYVVDGVLVPSATTILRATVFADKYKDIPQYILDNAADFGNAIHEAVETGDGWHLDEQQYKVYQEYINLVKTANIRPVAHEQMIAYNYAYAGTYDMEAMIDGKLCLVDIKTTYKLDIEYLSWQLTMYAMASGKKYEKLYAIWLPKRGGAKLVEIPRKSNGDVLKLLEEYYGTRDESSIHNN